MLNFLPLFQSKTKIIRILVFIAWSSSFHHAHAQLDNSGLLDSVRWSQEQGSGIHVDVNYFGYLRNHEFFANPIIKGYTLFGHQLLAWARWQYDENVQLRAGVLVQQDFGSAFRRAQPLLSLSWRKNQWEFHAGTLQGHLHHGLIEPLMDFENIIQERVETGFQARRIGENWSMDIWVDWQNYLAPGVDDQERILSGVVADLRLLSSNQQDLFLKLQATIQHLGGQINVPAQAVMNHNNAAIGLLWNRKLKHKHLHKLSLEPYYLLYDRSSGGPDRPFLQGNAWYFNPSIHTTWGTLMISWWKGNQYIPSIGGRFYSSQIYDVRAIASGSIGPAEGIADRNFFIIRYIKEWQINDATHISLRVEPYYDTGNGSLEFSTGAFLHFKPSALIKQW